MTAENLIWPVFFFLFFFSVHGDRALPDKLIFNMIKGGNLLLETPDSRQTNFQYDLRW